MLEIEYVGIVMPVLLITILVLTCEHHHLTIARSDIQPPEVIRIWCWSMVSFIICIYS